MATYVWAVHPFNSSEWILKRITEDEENVIIEKINKNIINISYTQNGAVGSKDGFVVYNMLPVTFGNVSGSCIAPDEVNPQNAVLYDIMNAMAEDSGDRTIIDFFANDERIFTNLKSDDDERKERNNFLDTIAQLRNVDLNLNSILLETDEEEDDEEDEQ